MSKLSVSVREEAAQMVAEGRYELTQIAEKLGITRQGLHKLRRTPAFAARVDEISREFADAALKRALARKDYRITCLANRHSLLREVIEARAAAPDMQEIPGGHTGIMVRKPVTSKDGICGYEFVVDTGTLKELRAVEEQVAKELGQFVEKREVKADVIHSLKDATDDELDAELDKLTTGFVAPDVEGAEDENPGDPEGEGSEE